MTISSISTAYLGTVMLSAVQQTQQQLTTLETESATGQYADLGLQLGEQSGYELSLKTHDDLLQTLTTSNQLVTTNISVATSALDSIHSAADNMISQLTAAQSATSSVNLQAMGDDALQSFITETNATSAGAYVFGGINTGAAPLSSYSLNPASGSQTALESAFQANFGFPSTSAQAASITPQALQSFLTGPFAAQFSGSNWSTNWSSASSTNIISEIAPGQNAVTSTNANEPGFQQIAQGYAMLASLGGSALNSSAMQTLISTATQSVTSGMSSLTQSEATLGIAQTQITQSNSAMNSQMSILQTQIGNMDDVNAEKIATQLNSLQTQLETAYQLTAKLQSLSLAQYLPT